MAYSKVERRTWNDERFRRWPKDRRDVWLYLLTAPHLEQPGGRFGCCVLDPMYAAADLSAPDDRWPPERVEAQLTELEREGRIVWDPDTRLVLLVHFLEYNKPENPNVVRAMVRDIESIPYSERVMQTLLATVRERLPKRFEKGGEMGSAIEVAIASRMEREAKRQTPKAYAAEPYNVVHHNNINSSGTVAPTVSKGFGQPFPNHEHEHEQEQEHEHIPVVAAAISPRPAHAREESAAPPAAADAERAVAPDDPAEHIQAMRQLVEEAARDLPGAAGRRLIGEFELIVTGDDVTAWRDTRGEPVPWPDRPRLLRLALQRWKLDRDQYPKPRSALLYVIAQQYDPRPVGGMSAEEEAEHYARHRNGAGRRIGSEVSPVAGVVGIDAPREPDRPEDRSAQQWAREHPERFQEFVREVAASEGLRLDDTLARLRATGLALQRVREEVLA